MGFLVAPRVRVGRPARRGRAQPAAGRRRAPEAARDKPSLAAPCPLPAHRPSPPTPHHPPTPPQVLPSTFQVYGANVALKGNETLAPMAPPAPVRPLPAAPLDLGFTAPTNLSAFPGLEPTADTTAAGVTPRGAAAPAGAILPSDASIFAALDNMTAPAAPANATVAPGLEPTTVVAADTKAKSGAAGRAAGAAAVVAAAALALLL